jgi:glucokinase
MILAGDTGGTKTRLALYEAEGEKFRRLHTETFVSRDYLGLEDIIRLFLDKHHVAVSKACFGVPGPVGDGEAITTNLPWKLKESQIARAVGIPAIRLVNDLVAATAAIPYFTPDDLFILHEGKPEKPQSLCAVLAPGTGLGEAFLFHDGARHHVFASEGGHADFAPNREIEIKLLEHLKKKHSHVSYERVLCGPGLLNIYSFLKETGRETVPPELAARLKGQDPSAVISEAGLAGEFAICVKALDIFASILGAQAGNLVLTMLATGGVYLGGGIPPKILKKLTEGGTLAAYFDKGRLSDLVKNTPLYVIRDDHAALLGAASLATELS